VHELFTPEGIADVVDDETATPRSTRRPRSRHKLVDLFLDAAFSFTGPAQVSYDEEPPRGPRTEEEAQRGYGTWERVTVGGHSYLVEKREPPRPAEG
jgi:hypothetical protein